MSHTVISVNLRQGACILCEGRGLFLLLLFSHKRSPAGSGIALCTKKKKKKSLTSFSLNLKGPSQTFWLKYKRKKYKRN